MRGIRLPRVLSPLPVPLPREGEGGVAGVLRWGVTLLLVALLAGCGPSPDGGHGHPHEGGDGDHAADGDHGDHGDEATYVYTDFTDTTELFVEFPPLVAGQGSVFAAHVTRLTDFKPLSEGTLDVVLSRDGETAARFRVREPARPGIFTPEVVPREAGTFDLSVRVASGELQATHELGAVEVFADAASAAVPPRDDEGEITYLKEQQWNGRFALAMAAEHPLRPSIPGTATVYAAGSAGGGELVGYLKPGAAGDGDYGEALLAVDKARSELELARRELRRLQPLYEAGAIAERRLSEARQAREVAETRYQVAQARLQRHAPSSADGSSDAAGKRWLHVRVPEYSAGRLREVSGVWFRRDGEVQVLDVDHGVRVVRVGGAVDPVSRTVPVVLEYPVAQGPALLGASLTAHVYADAARPRLAVPASAVIDDGGRPVVYVQTGGESFTRRPVELGIQDGPRVEVLRGVSAGERVVSTGAYDVKLAGAGGDAVGHGHAH